LTLFALYLLATLDGLLCGCRTALGRCPLIGKRSFYVRALFHGFLAAQIASFFSLSVLVLVFHFSSYRLELHTDLEAAARRMLQIFVPYAAAVLFNLALRLVPSTDLRSANSVFALGPLTALRPLLMIAGVLYGIWHAHRFETRLLGLFVLALMLSIESVLNHLAKRDQTRQIHDLV
jgi:hypothetical protein